MTLDLEKDSDKSSQDHHSFAYAACQLVTTVSGFTASAAPTGRATRNCVPSDGEVDTPPSLRS